MKRMLLSIALFAVLVLCGCAGSEGGKAPAQGGAKPSDQAGPKALDEADLLHHKFDLVSINGEPFTVKERTPSIEFNEGMRISGQTCNRFMGQATLKDGVLTVPQMASTMMLCVDPKLNVLERDFAELLRMGASIRLEGDMLTLSREGYALVYKLNDLR